MRRPPTPTGVLVTRGPRGPLNRWSGGEVDDPDVPRVPVEQSLTSYENTDLIHAPSERLFVRYLNLALGLVDRSWRAAVAVNCLNSRSLRLCPASAPPRPSRSVLGANANRHRIHHNVPGRVNRFFLCCSAETGEGDSCASEHSLPGCVTQLGKRQRPEAALSI